MRPRFAGRTTARKGRLAPTLIAAAALLAVVLSVPSIRVLHDVEAARRADTHVAIAVDLDDIHAFVPEPTRAEFFSALRDVPVSLITVRDTLLPSEEALLRSSGFHLLWRLGDGADSAMFDRNADLPRGRWPCRWRRSASRQLCTALTNAAHVVVALTIPRPVARVARDFRAPCPNE